MKNIEDLPQRSGGSFPAMETSVRFSRWKNRVQKLRRGLRGAGARSTRCLSISRFPAAFVAPYPVYLLSWNQLAKPVRSTLDGAALGRGARAEAAVGAEEIEGVEGAVETGTGSEAERIGSEALGTGSEALGT